MRLRLLTRLTFTVIGLSVAAAARAQDPVFSQYTASATYNNPGMTGFFDGEVRLTANYRDQWASVLGTTPLRTFAGSGEVRYGIGGRDFIGVGLNAVHDAGGASDFTYTGAGLGVAVQKYLGGGRGRNANYLGFGGRVAYGQLGIDPAKLWYTSDIDTSSLAIHRGGGANGVNATGNAYLDVSVGGHYSLVRRDYSWTIGVAGHHLNWPNPSLLFDADLRLPPRYTGFVAAEFLLQKNLSLLPSATVDFQGQARRLQTGSGVFYHSGQEGDAGFRFGTYGRLTSDYASGVNLEAIVLVAQVEFARTAVGISYDVNTGEVGRTVNARGAYEISLSWTRDARSRYKVICPKL